MLTDTIKALIARDALFVVNHSGGKDSQAMMAKLLAWGVPSSQMLIVHAHLPGVEWAGVVDHIEATIPAGVPFRITSANKKDGTERTFMNMVEDRGFWPSPTQRQCTSDLKRGPIEREIRAFLKETGRHGLVVNCMGLRADESAQRAKAEVFKFSDRNSKAGREWYDWLPIHEITIDDVWATIAAAGQKPHWAYAEGMTRLSCMFCVMASKDDLRRSAMLNPAAFREVVEMERTIGQSFLMPVKGNVVFLEEALGMTVAEVEDAFGTENAQGPNLIDFCEAA